MVDCGEIVIKRYSLQNECKCEVGKGGSACRCHVFGENHVPDGEWVKYEDLEEFKEGIIDSCRSYN